MKTRLLLVSLLGVLLCSLTVFGADWPQFRGPNRDDISLETGLLKNWPKTGPTLSWTFEKAGVGFSGFSIVGGKLYTMGNRDGKDQVICVDAKNGKEVWGVEAGQSYDNQWGDGPRCTPTIDGELLYVLGPSGELSCLTTAKGEKRWQKNLFKDFQGEVMKKNAWGYCESPLVDGDNLICCPGGPKGTVLALNKLTGEQVWRSEKLTDPASYSSILPIEVGGVRQYAFLTGGKAIAGVAAKDGTLLWRSTEPVTDIAAIPMPIFADGHLYSTSDYGAGCNLLKLTPDATGTKAETVYANKTMENHHGGVVLVNGYIFGCSGNCNGRAKWVCQDFKTGEKVWAEEKLDPGSITCADGLLYLYGQKDGTCVLLEPSKEGWKEHGRFKIPKETKANRKQGRIWTHPVVADGHLFLRDNELLFCYDVRASKTK